MKKILLILTFALTCNVALFAQNGKAVNEKDVPERYVKDFQRQQADVKNVKWEIIDSMVYDARFVNDNGTETAIRFSPKGSETRWYIEPKYYPHAIVDNIAAQHPGYKIKELYLLNIKNKSTYQVLIGQRKGLFTKKWKHMRYMNYETDGKFIDEIEL